MYALTLLLLFACAAPKVIDSPPAINPPLSIVSVSAIGDANNYTFAVGIRSEETGCEQYADWWEVLDSNEKLVYRRILEHSHPEEQPFVRTGGPVIVAADQMVYVRAHLHGEISGYSTPFSGTVEGGFFVATVGKDFGRGVETEEPLPTGCLF